MSYEGDASFFGKVVAQLSKIFCFALSCKLLFEGWILSEVVLDDMLSQPRDDEDRFDSGLEELLDSVVDERSVEDGQHFFGNGFRRRQHARAEPCGGNNSFTNGSGRHGKCERQPERVGEVIARRELFVGKTEKKQAAIPFDFC